MNRGKIIGVIAVVLAIVISGVGYFGTLDKGRISANDEMKKGVDRPIVVAKASKILYVNSYHEGYGWMAER